MQLHNLKGQLKIYGVGIGTLFLLLQMYLYLPQGNKHYLITSLFSAQNIWADRSFFLAYIYGVLISGFLTIFYARNIKKWKLILVPLCTVFTVYFLINVLYLKFDTATEMPGLGAMVIYRFLLPVNLLFAFGYSIYVYNKENN